MANYIGSEGNQYYNDTSMGEESDGEGSIRHLHDVGEHSRSHSHTTQNTNRTPRQHQPEPQVLQPDNPLMERFQAALRTHLLNQKKRLDEEIMGLKITMKGDTKSYQTSIEVREMEQQAVLRQNITLEKERESTEKVIVDREKIEADLHELSSKCKEVATNLADKRHKEEELRLEKESLAALISQFSEWEQSQNSEITIAQRISEKNQNNKLVYTQEKIYQDILLLSLTSEVLKLTTKFGELEKNIKQKQGEVETISQSVADGNADLEALERENRKLMIIWNTVIQQIQQRDGIMMDIKTQLLSAREQYSRLVCQVDSYKRSSGAEVKQNETLTTTLVRLEGDIEVLEKIYVTEEEKQRKLRENLVQVANMAELTQRDINVIAADTKEKEAKYNTIQIEIDKLLQIKYQLEEEMMKKLHNQVVLSKAEKQSTKLVTTLQTNARKLESQLAFAQNALAKLLLLIEQENKLIKDNSLSLDQEKVDDIKRDRELKEAEMGLKRHHALIARKRSYNDTLNSRLVELSQKGSGGDLTPDELQIKCLEKTLAEMTDHIEDLQTSWMREQNRIVALTHQRNDLNNQLTIYHKQILVMKQKQLKTEFEIENLKKEESNMKRQISSLEKRLTSLNLQCSQRKDYKENLDNQNLVAQNQLICELKDAEVKALTLQEEMCYLEIEKEEMRGRIVEAQRDLLAWEKKMQMATEVKTSIDKARADGGEIAVMKSEIHRMEVRYAQLQKVQEKLAHDMEMCISRRDGIVELSQAKEKRSTKRALYTRQQFQKKLDDIQSKIKQINSELKSINKSIGTSEEHLNELAERENMKKNQLGELQTAVAQMQAQLAEGQLHRQKNLEMLVRKQRKARQYGELKAGRYSLLFRQESALELETQKQKTVNADLVSTVESLQTDFPILENPMTQILNTLRSPAA